jgi:hypothetical protein
MEIPEIFANKITASDGSLTTQVEGEPYGKPRQLPEESTYDEGKLTFAAMP